ncbi:MAG: hypothetical protein IJX81_06435 [Clostridia bacterium]|nr:hypothetical protein [Clostridia bacterium]
MITKTAKRFWLAICACVAAVCTVFGINYNPTPVKASTTSDLTEVTMNKVTANKGVAAGVDYLEFDGFSGDTYFLVEFDGQNAPNFAFNAVQGYETWNAEMYSTSGVIMSYSSEAGQTGTRLQNGLNTTGVWKTFDYSYGIANFSATAHYVMIVGFDHSSRTFYNYIYTYDTNGLTLTFTIEESVGVSYGTGSKAVIYPNINFGADAITFKYATPQTTLSGLVNGLPETCAYKQALHDDLNGSFAFEATMNKVYATKGVAENVEYLEFDGFSGDTWFGLEFTGQSIPNFAVNAKQAFSTWNANSYTEAGVFISHSNENNWGTFRVTNSFNTTTGHFNTQSGSSAVPTAIGYLKANVKYLMFLGYDKDDTTLLGDSATKGHNSIYYYLFSVETDGTLTKIVGKSLYHGGLSDSLGSKAVIYPHLRCNDNTGYDTYSPTITFNYLTPQKSLHKLVDSISVNHPYRAQLEEALKDEEPYYGQELTISSTADHNLTGKTFETISFDGFDGDTYMLVDFVGKNMPSFGVNATTVYSEFAGTETNATLGNIVLTKWGTLHIRNAINSGDCYYGSGGFPKGEAYYTDGVSYVALVESKKAESKITLYIYTVDSEGNVTAACDPISATHPSIANAQGDKAVIYPYIGAGTTGTTTFNIVKPAATMNGLLANIPASYAYKASLTAALAEKSTVTVKDADGSEITTASVTTGESYTLPACANANFIGWTVNGGLYKAGASVTIDGDTTVTATYLDLSMIAGASIRIASTTDYHGGLRFHVKVNAAQLAALNVKLYGFVLPTDMIDGDLDISEGTNATELTNFKAYEEDEAYSVYYITLTNVLYSNYNREFSAMAYATITYADGTTANFATAYNEEDNSRSCYEVAVLAYNDTAKYATYSSTQKGILKEYIDCTVNLVYVDAVTYTVATSEDGLSAAYVRGYSVMTSYDSDNERLVFKVTINVPTRLISTSDNLPHVPVTVWTYDADSETYVAERILVTVQSYENGVATLFFR